MRTMKWMEKQIEELVVRGGVKVRLGQTIAKPAFALLWSKILDSSLWVTGSKETAGLITLLALKDYEGRVNLPVVSLADRLRFQSRNARKP
jgi:hypothetical protein